MFKTRLNRRARDYSCYNREDSNFVGRVFRNRNFRARDCYNTIGMGYGRCLCMDLSKEEEKELINERISFLEENIKRLKLRSSELV